MERQMHISGQTLYFEADPGGSIAHSYLVGPGEAIQVAQVQPWGKMIGQKVKVVTEDMDRNREVAERMAIAWNATRHLTMAEIEAVRQIGQMAPPPNDEAEEILQDLARATIPRSRVHLLLNRLVRALA